MKFYTNYVTCVIREGVTFSITESRRQTQVILEYFGDKPFVYITHRIHSYAVNPTIYNETSEIENLVGFAVVSKKYFALKNTEIENLFLSKPLKTFENLADAKKWAEKKVLDFKELKA